MERLLFSSRLLEEINHVARSSVGFLTCGRKIIGNALDEGGGGGGGGYNQK